MLVGEFGNTFKTINPIEFDSDQALYDYDLIFMDLKFILNLPHKTYGPTYLSKFHKRTLEIAEYLNIPNKYIICFTPLTKEIKFSQPLNRSTSISTLSILIDPNSFETIASSGTKINILESPLKDIFLKYRLAFRYENYFNRFIGTPLMTIENTDKTISILNKKILFIPNVITLLLKEKEFFNDLYIILEKIYTPKINFDSPIWSEKYFLPEENKYLKSVIEIENQIKVLITEKNVVQQKIEELRLCKHLFTGTGKSLEQIVEKVFIELGFTILKKEVTNKDDIIARIENKVLVIEVKGLNGTAAQKNARQLENWLTDYEPENETIQVKGLLVVNSFKDILLEERTEPTFPHSMLEYSIKREHCLMTGLQLLGILINIQRDPSKKDNIIDSIFSTNSVYKGYEDWHQFLEAENEAKEYAETNLISTEQSTV